MKSSQSKKEESLWRALLVLDIKGQARTHMLSNSLSLSEPLSCSLSSPRQANAELLVPHAPPRPHMSFPQEGENFPRGYFCMRGQYTRYTTREKSCERGKHNTYTCQTRDTGNALLVDFARYTLDGSRAVLYGTRESTNFSLWRDESVNSSSAKQNNNGRRLRALRGKGGREEGESVMNKITGKIRPIW